jgi:hypothetical protein
VFLPAHEQDGVLESAAAQAGKRVQPTHRRCNVTDGDLACNSGAMQCGSSYSTMDESSSAISASRSEISISTAAREEISSATKELSSHLVGSNAKRDGYGIGP